MLVPAVGFARRYPLPGNAAGLTDIGKLAEYGVAEFTGYVGGLAAMFLLYALALREAGRLPAGRALPAVFGIGAGLAAAFALMYPVNAIDLFIYAVRSRLLTSHGVDPNAAMPLAYWEIDPLMRFASREWADEVSPYGPLWNLIAAPITAVAGDGLLVALLGFKALAVAALLLGGWLIARALTRGGEGVGGEPAVGALFYLWNPLVLWEGIGNGHNDVVMAVPLLLAFLDWERRRDSRVFPWLVVAGLIKYVAAVLLPLAAVALWRRAAEPAARRRLVGRSAGLSLAAAAAALFPFYDVGAIRSSLAAQAGIFATSPAAIAVGLLRDRMPEAAAERAVSAVGLAVFAAGLAWWAAVVWAEPGRLPRAAFEALFLFLLVAAWNWRPWYLIWLAALAALLPWGWPAWRTIAWGAGGLAGYALFIWGWHWWPVEFQTIQRVAVPLMTGPALALTLVEAGRAVGRRRGNRQVGVLPGSRARIGRVPPTERRGGRDGERGSAD